MNLKSTEKYGTFFVCGVIFLLMLYLNSLCGFYADDFHFQFVWKSFAPTDSEKPVSEFSDILLSIKNYYNFSGGRVIPHFLAYCFVNIPKQIFNIINSAMFVFFGIAAKRFLFGKNSVGSCCLFMIYFSLLFFIPYFGDDVLWISGAVNYIWSCALLLCAIIVCTEKINMEKSSDVLLVLFTGGLSSLTNETTGGMLLVYFTCLLIVKRKKPNFKVLLYYTVCTLCASTVITAPGNSYRATHFEIIRSYEFIDLITLAGRYADYVVHECRFILLFAMLLIIAMVSLKKITVSEIIKEIAPLFITSVAGTVALSLSFTYTERPAIFGIVLIIVMTWKILFMIKSRKSNKITDNNECLTLCAKRVVSLLVSFCAMCLFRTFYMSIDELFESYFITIYMVLLILIGIAVYILMMKIIKSISKSIKKPKRKLSDTVDFFVRHKKKCFCVILTASVAVTAYNAVYFAYDVANANEVNVKNYRNFVSGNKTENANYKIKSKFYPEQVYNPTDTSWVYWIRECEKYNIIKPETEMYFQTDDD